MKKLSIIIINQNRDFCIELCMKSIIRQKKEFDELIIVDDSSSDDSMRIIKQYKNIVDIIKIVDSKENRAFVRNTGAKCANNEILVFVDSDVILDRNNLEIVRKAHEDNNNIAINGNVFCNTYDVEQFEFSSNLILKELAEKLYDDFSILHKYPRYFDHRYQNTDIENSKNIWHNFYSTYASIRKDVFFEVGMFDEKFKTWGAEDIDLAYRLSKKGNVIFIPEIVSFHYPHYKNYFVNFKQDVSNLYYMLDKYRNLEMEILCSFFSNIDDIKFTLQKMFSYIMKHNKTVKMPLDNGDLYIGFPTCEYPEGYVIYKEEDSEHIIKFCGLALPFENKRFNRVFFSQAYSLISEPVICMIFQEAIRIAELVLLPKKKMQGERFSDEDDIFSGYSFFALICYISQYLLDFEISTYDEVYNQVSWKPEAKIYLYKDIE